jgi:alkanesulfonate monooxygenase SsuD/methylene tetrahydromethanopterin reductase-like flavin-dependent oxidoreductase (luciferase family)
MRIGLALPHYDFSFPDGRPVTWERLLAAAQRAESLGFDSAWISDHFFLDTSSRSRPSRPWQPGRRVCAWELWSRARRSGIRRTWPRRRPHSTWPAEGGSTSV